MKIIDIHAHFFPDSIAKNTIKALVDTGQGVNAYGEGTMASLKEYMLKDGITVSINQPVATKKEQVTGINRKMIEFNKKRSEVICFGCMHPEFKIMGSVTEEIEFIAKNGIKGIKLHPEYQQFYPDDPGVAEIYEACRKNNVIILFHAGVDLGIPTVHADPKRLLEVSKVDGLKLVMAHLGSYKMWDDVLKYLAGKNVYFDTAYTAGMEDKVIKDIVKAHGSERIIFGSDFPWERAINVKNKLDAVLNDADKENIYYKNACGLLNINL